MKRPSLERIEIEETELKQLKEELTNLQSKWIKLPSTLRLIAFLEFYVKEKNTFIKRLKEFKHE